MKNLRQIVSRFNKARIMVVGDLILDEYIVGAVDRISPEAPVPVVWAQERRFVPGGAANVANNIAAYDAQVCLVGVTGEDENAQRLLAQLQKRGISCGAIFAEPNRYTTVKTRIIGGHQQIVRLDWEHVEPLPKTLDQKIIAYIKKNIFWKS
jgi:rfaE bifunctional protein kinase chain/domain